MKMFCLFQVIKNVYLNINWNNPMNWIILIDVFMAIALLILYVLCIMLK